MSKTCVRVWHKRFLAGCTSKHTGRPHTTRTTANIQKIRDLLDQVKRLSVHEISDQTKIPHSGVHTMLKKDMRLSKVAPKIMPKLLTDEQKCFSVVPGKLGSFA